MGAVPNGYGGQDVEGRRLRLLAECPDPGLLLAAAFGAYLKYREQHFLDF